MKDIQKILEKPYVDRGAYNVPDGYFASLNDRIMSHVDAEQTPTRRLSIWKQRPLRYAAAACVAGIVVTLGAWFYTNNNSETQQMAEQAQPMELSDDYVQQVMEYAMVDNDDIYRYLSEQ